ncbi:hypothetical protein SLA2020_151300 [Shorea laevis]
MDINVENQQPLLENKEPQEVVLGKHQPSSENSTAAQPKKKPSKTKRQKVVRKAFKGTAHLAKLLPTGSVLTFQILSPVLTRQGQCKTPVNQYMTMGMVALCAASCFIQSFTDSFRNERGKVRYGVATFRGLWVVDGSVKLSAEEKEKYKLRFVDFFHAFVSLLVFAAVALFDQNVVKCFNPTPSEEVKELLAELPVAIGVVCSVLFVAFPSRRHGVGAPLSRE